MKHRKLLSGALILLLLLTSAVFCAVGLAAGTSQVTLELVGSTFYANEDYRINVSAPGATRVRICREGDPDWGYDLDVTNGFAQGRVSSEDNASFYALACYEEPGEGEPAFTGRSNTVTLRPICLGDGSPAEVHADDAIARGDLLPVTVTLTGDDNRFEVHLHAVAGDETGEEILWCGDYEIEENGTLEVCVPTAFLEEGMLYRVLVLSHGFGERMVQDESNAVFAVDEGARSMVWQVTPSEVLVHQNAMVIASLPLVRDAYIVWENGEDTWEDHSYDSEHQVFISSVRFSYPGDAEGTVYVYNDISEEYESPGRSIDVNVISNGELTEPMLEMPMSIEPGEALTVTTDRVGYADRYDVCVFDETAEEDVYRYEGVEISRDEDTERGSFTIPANVFTAGHSYDVFVEVYAEEAGFVKNGAHRSVFVMDERDRNLSIEVEPGEYLVNEDFEMTVHAPGATFVRLYFVGDGTYYRDLWDNEGRGYDSYTLMTSVDGPKLIFARASYDEGDDPEEMTFGGMSNAIEITPTALGVGTPADIEVPPYVEYGKLMPVVITPNGNTTDLFLQVTDDDGEWMYGREMKVPATAASVTMYVPTLNLEYDKDYRVSVFARGYGEYWVENNDADWKGRFTLTENAQELQPEIIVSAESPMIWDDVEITASVPGAVDAYLAFDPTDITCKDFHWEAGCLVTTMTTDKALDYDITLMADYDDGEGFVEAGSFELDFYDNGELAKPTYTSPKVLLKGSDLVVNIDSVANAEEYWFYIDDETLGKIVYENRSDENATQTVDADVFEVGHKYVVCVVVEAPEGRYSSNGDGKEMRVIENDTDLITLRLPSGLTAIEREAFAHTSAQKIIVPKDVTDIGEFAFADCGVLLFVEFEGDEANIADEAFEGTEGVSFICEPEGKVAAYAAENGISVMAKG